MIFNEAARREFEMQVGDRINGFVSPDEQIVGFCADFNFKPLQYGVSPFCFYLLPKKIQQENYWHLPHVVYVRMTPGADIAAVTAHIRRCIAEVDLARSRAISSSVFSTRSWASSTTTNAN